VADRHDSLELRFAGQLVEQLGAQLYPRVTSSVAELISNAWDADATNVWVTIPFDRKWDESAVIEVLDNGHGMTHRQAQDRYLIVGRNRRREDGATSEGGRVLHGRKGIGKLAAFGTAGYLELVTKRDGRLTAFGIDYDKLRKLPPTSPYTTEKLEDLDALVDPKTGEELEHGTRVRLSRLKAKRRSPEVEFRRSMGRRFALDVSEMTVFINGEPLSRFDYDVSVRFPRDGRPSNALELTVDENGWGIERLDAKPLVEARRERLRRELEQAATDTAGADGEPTAGADDEPTAGADDEPTADAADTADQADGVAESAAHDAVPGEASREHEIALADLGIPTLRDDETVEIRWWIGFSPTPIPEEDVRGVSILARGKLAQRPFMFEMTAGTQNQLQQEYLVGEVQADWIDIGRDADDDLIQSNRDQLQLDNEELQPLLTWGRERLRWAMAEFGRRRREQKAGPEALGREVESIIQKAPSRSRERFRTLAARISDLTPDTKAVARAVEAVVQATDVAEVEKARKELRLEGDPDDQATWALLGQAAEAATDVSASLLETRADALRQFADALHEPPVTDLHRRAATEPWIISPILALLPRDGVDEDDGVSIARFDGLEPLVRPWTLVCFAVDIEAPIEPVSVNGSSIVVASTKLDVGKLRLTWKEALTASEAAHRALLEVLRSQ
jgi:hypothetical protein